MPKDKQDTEQILIPNTAINLAKAFNLRFAHGLSYSAISSQLDTPKSTVYEALKPFDKILTHAGVIDVFKSNEPDLLSGVKLRLLSRMADDAAIKDASVNNAAYAYSQLNHAERLARGEATENINIRAIKGELTELQKQRLALEQELAHELKSEP